MTIKTVGFPVMRKEKNEVRAFLPSFIRHLQGYDVEVVLEKGYGSGMGYTEEQYRAAHPGVRFASWEEVYRSDLVIVLRYPGDEQLAAMRAGSGLLSMIHYDSNPELCAKLKRQNIQSFSLDSIVDDHNRRMVVTYEQTAWAGVETTFREMAKRRADFFDPHRPPYRVVILGMGPLGIQAGRACFNYSLEHFLGRSRPAPGITVTYLERDTTYLKEELQQLFRHTDVLIDATRRPDFTRHIITNDLVGCLKKEALILDLSADHYDAAKSPPQVKAIEGLPYGTLDRYVLETDAAEYADLPPGVSTRHRRVTVSCNGWPGVFPEKAMKIYETELLPLVETLLTKGFALSLDSVNPYERALYRATLPYFEANYRQEQAGVGRNKLREV